MHANQRLVSVFPYLILLIPLITGMFLDVMDIDSAQYAAISKEMYETGNYLQVYDKGKDYLDKPPLLFWVSSLMYSIFGVNHFVFRIIPLMVSFLGVYATHRFTKLYYDDDSARNASLIFASCQAFFLMNHDVRTDTMLTGFTISSIWLISSYMETQNLRHFILGFICLGFALLAKGPIGLMVPVLAIGSHLVLKKKWNKLFDLKYLFGVLIIALMLLPMCIGLYLQFDAHPEKESGLYFYFWKQSFGRLTGENEWANNPPITFLAENFLWSFLPWTMIFIPALVQKCRQLLKLSSYPNEELITLFGFLLPFIALSTSKYQLPHYIFILFPLAAVISGVYLEKLNASLKWINSFKLVQTVTFVLITIVMLILGFWSFKGVSSPLLLSIIVMNIAAIYLLIKGRNVFRAILIPSVLFISGLNLFLNAHFYPEIFKFQSGSVIGKYIKSEKSVDASKLIVMGKDVGFSSLDFYSGVRAPVVIKEDDILKYLNSTFWLYTNLSGLGYMNNLDGIRVEKELSTLKFHVSTLNGKFLNPTSRIAACDSVFLLKISPVR